jgi:hypothetical protein
MLRNICWRYLRSKSGFPNADREFMVMETSRLQQRPWEGSMMISFDRGLGILSQQSWLDHPLKCRLAFRSFYVPLLVFTIPNPTASVRLLSPSTFLNSHATSSVAVLLCCVALSAGHTVSIEARLLCLRVRMGEWTEGVNNGTLQISSRSEVNLAQSNFCVLVSGDVSAAPTQ